MPVNNNLSKAPQSTLKSLIKKMDGEIAKALPSMITPERFTRSVMTAISNTPELEKCTQTSFLSAMMQSAQLGLEPNTPLGYAYILPYGNKAQFILGYQGLIALAYRNPDMQRVAAGVVYENDKFTYALGLEPDIKHEPALVGRGKPIAYYGLWKTKKGGFGFEVMSVEDVQKHGEKFSKTYHKGPWTTDFDEMAKKTVLKKALKYAPLSIELANAIGADESIKSSIDKDMSSVPNEFYDVEFEEHTEEPQQPQPQPQQDLL